MSMLDENWFHKIRKPSRYLGNEINSIKKDPNRTEVSVALAFPDVYEIGMSHLGLKILYNLLNSRSWILAERVFAPWVDLEHEMRQRHIPLTSLENHRPISGFDVLGFSIQHELCYTNVLNMLDLSGIPIFASKRPNNLPLIIAGGPSCFNPEPLAEFFDIIVIGDGEELCLKICHAVRKAKKSGRIDKQDIFAQLYGLKGIYIPSYFKIHYSQKHAQIINNIEPLIADYACVEKAVIPDIDEYPYPKRQIVPYTELIHDRVAVEVSRGCTRGCRFCQAGMIYRPVRERNPETVIENVESALTRTGYDEFSLLSLSTGDYSCISVVLKNLMDKQANEKTAISLPSLRVDSLNPMMIEQIKRVRKTGFTLAPEAGNDRLRRIINKGLSQDEIIETAKFVYDSGWNLLKLYFMIGLPFEEENDIQDIIHLTKQISRFAKGTRSRNAKLNVSVSTFVPKSHTPFMWVSQIGIEESRRRIKAIQTGLPSNHIRVKWNQPEMSWLEGVFARGDRKLSKLLIEAWRMGARFDSWAEHFNLSIWETAFKRSNLLPDTYLYRTRQLDEILPWDHIRSGVTKNYLIKEWKKAQKREFTPDCRKRCLECGVCNHITIDPVLVKAKGDDTPHSAPEIVHLQSVPKKIRLTFTKTGHTRYLGHLETVRLFIRCFRRMGLKLAYSKGFHPMPKVSFAYALPVGTESLQETIDLELVKMPNLSSLRDRIKEQLPNGMDIVMIEKIESKAKGPKIKESHFVLSLSEGEFHKQDLKRALESDRLIISKKSVKGLKKIDARSLIKSMQLLSPMEMKLVLLHHQGPALRPAAIAKYIFSLTDSQISSMRILKTQQLLESLS